jgi:hypothetical protein
MAQNEQVEHLDPLGLRDDDEDASARLVEEALGRRRNEG